MRKHRELAGHTYLLDMTIPTPSLPVAHFRLRHTLGRQRHTTHPHTEGYRGTTAGMDSSDGKDMIPAYGA